MASLWPAVAQTQAPGPTVVPSVAPSANGPYDVFVNSSISKGKPGLFFVDARTGLSNIVVTNGQHHTLLHNGVLFQEIGTNLMKVAFPDGRIEPFAAIQLPDPKANLAWIASGDGNRVVWVISESISQTQSQPNQQSVSSDMYLAGADGSNVKLILHSSSTKGIQTLPLAVTLDGTTVFYARVAPDKRPYGLFTVASDIFSLDVASGTITELPGKTACECAVGVSANGTILARLESAGTQDFGLHVWNLALKTDTLIAPPGLPNLQAGNVVFSSDNRLVAYTSARGVPPAKGVPPEHYAIVIADLGQRAQRVVIDNLRGNLQPIAFEHDNDMLILVGADSDGTYKLDLSGSGNSLLQVSAYTLLGTIGSVP